ncbi:MAG: leucine-rich repeat protein, partial [Clostridia bacterium]|nr:leucine-rich repeat protein [Clostridia bacterium]
VQTEPEYEKIMSLLKDDAELRFSYEEKAAKIDDALDNFKKLIGSADNDVFICVKISASTEADPARNGTTEDYKFALKVYDDLKKRGIKVFFSYVTLKNDVKSDEKIWSYLVKSKKMLLIGSSSEYLESAWVQSEWKRWLHLKREDELYICTLNGPEESWLDILPQEIATLEPQIYTRSTYEKMLDDICANTEISHKEDDVKIAEESPKQDGRIVYKDGSFEVLKYGIMEVHIPYSHDEPEYTRYNRMTEVYIPNSVKIVSKQAFSGATGIKKVVLSSNTEVIGNDAFNGCRVLQEISLPPTLESIGERAFANCKDMKKLHIRGKLIKIENLAFANCERLSEVIFDEGINVESEHFTSCFRGCKNLTDITVPEGIETIEVFYECPRLRTVRLPKSTRKIASFAFNNNSIDKACAVTDIYYSGTKEEWKNIEIEKYNNKLTGIFGRIKIHYNS